MAEEDQEQQEDKKSGGSFLTLLLVTILALAAGAGGSYALFGGRAQPVPAEGAEAAVEDPVEKDAEEFRERLFQLEPFVVNVTDEGYQRYLKIKMDLELEGAEARDEVEARTPQVRDTIIVLLTSKRLADITNFEGKALLKGELVDRVNAVLQQGRVRSVLFTEFVIQ